MTIILQQKAPIRPTGPTKAPRPQPAHVPLADHDFGSVFTQRQESTTKANVDNTPKTQPDANLAQGRMLGRQGIQRQATSSGGSPKASKMGTSSRKGRASNPAATTDGSTHKPVVTKESVSTTNPSGNPTSGSSAPVEGAKAGTGGGSFKHKSDR